MHTTKVSPGLIFLHNGDYSGDVILRRLKPGNQEVVGEVAFPYSALVEFVGQSLRDAKVSVLQEISGTDFLMSLAKRDAES